jgi:hypothetical protein
VLLIFIDNAHGDNAEHECASKANHERGGHHRAAMLFVLAALASRRLDVALLAVYVWFWLEGTGDALS